MDLELRSKVALVAASSRGLGRAAAEALAAEGVHLVLCARHEAELEATAASIRDRFGVEVAAVPADLSQPADVERVLVAAAAFREGVDVLVTNAGGPRSGLFDTLTDADWQAAVELTLMSVVRLCRGVVASMRARGSGRIIHITSASVKQPIGGLMLSNALRAAVVGFSKTLATELAPHGITVNCVAPGYTLTDRVAELNAASAVREQRTVEEISSRLIASIPAGRYGEPRELAALITFLASRQAAYLTGTTIAVDGGFVRSIL